MATWQVDFDFIPRQKITDKYCRIPDLLESSTAESSAWWQDAALPESYIELLAACLPRVTSWTENLEVWGDYEGNTVQIFRQDDKEIDSINARLDARKIDDSFVVTLASLASLADCLLLTNDGKLLEPDAKNIMAAVRQSAAVRFLTDPNKFFEELDQSNE